VLKIATLIKSQKYQGNFKKKNRQRHLVGSSCCKLFTSTVDDVKFSCIFLVRLFKGIFEIFVSKHSKLESYASCQIRRHCCEMIKNSKKYLINI